MQGTSLKALEQELALAQKSLEDAKAAEKAVSAAADKAQADAAAQLDEVQSK